MTETIPEITENNLRTSICPEDLTKNHLVTKKEKKFSYRKLSQTDVGEQVFKSVKKGLDHTSKGLLSMILIGNKIIDSSKKVLKKQNSPEIKISIEDESRENLVSDLNTHQDIESQIESPESKCKEKSLVSVKESLHEISEVSSKVCSQTLDISELDDLSDDEEGGCDSGGIGYCRSHDLNFTGMFIHLIGDVISSLCVIVSSIVVVNFGWLYFDTVCSIIICIFIILSTVPLNYMIFKKMANAFSVTAKEQKYILGKIKEVSVRNYRSIMMPMGTR